VTEEPRRALVIVAHPDDAEFTCAGTVARLVSEGWDVRYVLVTSGDMGSHDEGMTREKLGPIREREQRAAAKVLGVSECVFLREPDGFVEDSVELRGKLVREIRRSQPHTLITWDPFRRAFNHRDHRVTGLAALDAAYPLARTHLSFPEQLDDGLRPHSVREVLLVGADQPDYHVDVTETFEKKVQALGKHKSQIGRWPVREIRKRLRGRMEEAGKEAGYPLAEAFRRISWG
jgi:LmbE family N-acetylglucosaminyl deacetylase